MAYLHCHSCDWAQDDFYSKSYNPTTKIWSDIKWLWKPRIIDLENFIVEDLIKYTHVPIIKKKSGHQYKFFSWNWLLLEIVKDVKLALKQKWWTWESWQKDKKAAVCPKCGDRNFDID